MTTYVAHPEPRHVGAGRAVAWIGGGWDIFMRAPMAWLAIGVVCLLFLLVASIPGPGSMLATIFFPLLMAGLLDCARVSRDNGGPSFGLLFAGFQRNAGNLLVTGVLLSIASLLSFTIWGGIVLAGGGMSALSALQNALNNDLLSLADLKPFAISLAIALVVMLVLMTLIMMMAWFAPALVLFDNMAPLAALRKSFAACLCNWLVLAVHGLLIFVLMCVAMLTMVGVLVIAPLVATSVYLSYRDIFH